MSELLTFYGDDFTGSTDVALQYHRFGLRTMLVTDVPDPARARELAAGVRRARHRGPDPLAAHGGDRAGAAPALRRARRTRPAARPVQGLLDRGLLAGDRQLRPGPRARPRALRRAARAVARRPARASAATRCSATTSRPTAARVHRLDRQPTMANHPVTPMRESDLRLHLAAQTPLAVAGLDVLALAGADGGAARWAELSASGAGAVVVDALDESAPARRRASCCSASAPRRAPPSRSGRAGSAPAWPPALTGRERAAGGAPVAPVERALVVVRLALRAHRAPDRARARARLGRASRSTCGARRRRGAERARGRPRRRRGRGRALASAPGVIVHSSPGRPFARARSGGRRARRGARPRRRRVPVRGAESSAWWWREGTHRATSRARSARRRWRRSGPSAGRRSCAGSRPATPPSRGLELVLKGGQIGHEDLFEAARTGEGSGATGRAPA